MSIFEDTLSRWHRTIRLCQVEHELASRHYEKLNWKLGVPVVVFSSIVGAALFASLQKSDLTEVKIIAGGLSLLSAVLSSVQTFMKFGERSTNHKIVADSLAGLMRRIQQVRACPIEATKQSEFLEEVRVRWDQICKEAPLLRNSIIKAVAADSQGIDPIDLREVRSRRKHSTKTDAPVNGR